MGLVKRCARRGQPEARPIATRAESQEPLDALSLCHRDLAGPSTAGPRPRDSMRRMPRHRLRLSAPVRRCCATWTSSVQARAHPRPHRPERIRQEHACEHHRRPLRPLAGTTRSTAIARRWLAPSERAGCGLRRTFQAARTGARIDARGRMSASAFTAVCPASCERAAIWPLLPSGRRDMGRMLRRADDALRSVGAGRGPIAGSATFRMESSN